MWTVAVLPLAQRWGVTMSELRQTVNFYRDEFKKPEIKLPAVQMAQIIGLVLIGFLVIGGYQLWELQSLQEKIAQQEQRKNQLQNQYESLESSFVQPTEDPKLLAQLKALNDQAEQKQRLRNFLREESGKSLFSFASVLDGLAGSDVSNIWLTQIRITTEGSRYELKGITRHADAIPEYIQALKQAEPLQGTSFSIFNIERDEKSEGLLHFTLSSEESNADNEG